MSSEPGLDCAFLRYIGVTSESQVSIRRFYVPMFDGCRQVVDLGCGGGDFVELLNQAGMEAMGVDSDAVQCESLRARNVPVVCQDALEFLRSAEDASLDGVYSAHLVEHLPYPSVLELVRQSFRVLRPGGRLVLATPNPRSPMSHLELFHMHFGHEAFYHPRLLMFFMDFCGFEKIEEGENPDTPSLLGNLRSGSGPMLADLLPLEDLDDYHKIAVDPLWESPLTGRQMVRRMVRSVKRLLRRFFVWPLLGGALVQLNEILYAKHKALIRVDLALQRLEAGFKPMLEVLHRAEALDRPFECYAIGYKQALEDPPSPPEPL